MKKILILVLSVLVLLPVVSACNSCSSSDRTSYEDEGYDGTYYYGDYKFSHTVTISGNTWSGTTIWYNDVEYEHGRVIGDKIYDPSGYFVIARIGRSLIRWNNHTLIKE